MSRGLRNGLVMIQSGPSLRPFAQINQEKIPTLVDSHFWCLLIAHNIEECILTTLMELRTSEWHELCTWTQQYRKCHCPERRGLTLPDPEERPHWLEMSHREAIVAMPWLRDFEDEWPLTVAWRRLDPAYPATFIRLK
ncbi:hypothetical protein B0H11DRAFT_2215080 [Mycena galericulata]|nr:hypothetical protein B0H11DRAFT_2215080 [Mycena galericulata]